MSDDEKLDESKWHLGQSNLGFHEGQWAVTRGAYPNTEWLVRYTPSLKEVCEKLLAELDRLRKENERLRTKANERLAHGDLGARGCD